MIASNKLKLNPPKTEQINSTMPLWYLGQTTALAYMLTYHEYSKTPVYIQCDGKAQFLPIKVIACYITSVGLLTLAKMSRNNLSTNYIRNRFQGTAQDDTNVAIRVDDDGRLPCGVKASLQHKIWRPPFCSCRSNKMHGIENLLAFAADY